MTDVNKPQNAPVTYDLENVLRLLTDVVNEQGASYEYFPPSTMEACAYFDLEDNNLIDMPDPFDALPSQFSPSCGVGHVLAKMGVTGADLYENDTENPYHSVVEYNTGYGVEGVFNDRITPLLNIHLTRDAEQFLSAFQADQDNGKNWGACLEKAKWSVGLPNDYEGSQEYRDEYGDGG